MSYTGFVGIMTQYCSNLKSPTVLEIGVDKGQTTLPLIHNLMLYNPDFKYVGVDIRMDHLLIEQMAQMKGIKSIVAKSDIDSLSSYFSNPSWEDDTSWNSMYIEQNSLAFLPMLAESGAKFDLVLIDGDHNYPTVKQELKYLKDITHPSSLVICDDYNSKRHSGKDSFYRDTESHKHIKDSIDVIQAVDGKSGADQAINEWIEQNEDWNVSFTEDLEPAILSSKYLKYSIENMNMLYKAMATFGVTPEGAHRFKIDNARRQIS